MSEFCRSREVVVLGDFKLPSLQWSAGDEMFVREVKRIGCFFIVLLQLVLHRGLRRLLL